VSKITKLRLGLHFSQVHYAFLFRIYGDLQTNTFLESL